MRFFIIAILLLLAVYQTSSKKHGKDEEEEEEAPKKGKEENKLNPVIDRLAMNLAGAFVKSIFPEMEQTTRPTPVPVNVQEVRRAPPNLFDLTSSGQNGLYSSIQNPFPNIGAVPGLSQYTTGGGGGLYRSDLPASYIYPYGQPGQLVSLGGGGQPFGLGRETLGGTFAQGVPIFPSGPTAPPESIDAINRYRKEQYLAELQHHQHELNQYTAKQLEYLDRQRKYQQSMLDQQAGAALLMQQQQQELLNKRMKIASPGELLVPNGPPQSEFEDETKSGIRDQQTGGHVLQNARNANPAKQFAARTQLENSFPHKDDREEYASDEYLRKFFKENYGIDIDENMNGEALTDEERATLRELKEHLIREAKVDGIKNGALKTLENYKNKIKARNRSYASKIAQQNGIELEKPARQRNSCEKCIPLELSQIAGAWTQIYGSPAALRKIYSVLLSLQTIKMQSGMVTTSLTPKKASCVGFQICLVKAGPAEQYAHDYIVLAEIEGPYRCRSYHIFARDSKEFKKRHYDDIADFMKKEVVESNIMPVAGLPKPHYCEVNA